jgi:hypothetical protein
MTSFHGCIPCQLWQGQVLPVWQKTGQFQKVDFRLIETGRAKELERADSWPDDLRWIRDAFVQDWQKWTTQDLAIAHYAPKRLEDAISMSPRFYVARDGALLESTVGKGGWLRHVQPLLDELVGRS